MTEEPWGLSALLFAALAWLYAGKPDNGWAICGTCLADDGQAHCLVIELDDSFKSLTFPVVGFTAGLILISNLSAIFSPF